MRTFLKMFWASSVIGAVLTALMARLLFTNPGEVFFPVYLMIWGFITVAVCSLMQAALKTNAQVASIKTAKTLDAMARR